MRVHGVIGFVVSDVLRRWTSGCIGVVLVWESISPIDSDAVTSQLPSPENHSTQFGPRRVVVPGRSARVCTDADTGTLQRYIGGYQAGKYTDGYFFLPLRPVSVHLRLPYAQSYLLQTVPSSSIVVRKRTAHYSIHSTTRLTSPTTPRPRSRCAFRRTSGRRSMRRSRRRRQKGYR